MTIDWIKAEDKLDKKQAVEGRILLELRSKGVYLKEKLEEANENLLQSKKKFHLLSEDHEKSTAANRRKIKEKEGTINNLNIEIDELKIELEKFSSKVSELEFLLKEKVQKFLQITNSSGSEISRITSELEVAIGKILEVENNLNRAISNSNAKDEEIRRLNGMIEELDTEKNNLEAQLKSLSEQKESEIQNLKSALNEKNILVEAQSLHVEEVEKELEDLKPPEVEKELENSKSLELEKSYYPYETRIMCPLDQAVGKDIREVEDKKVILYYRGGIPIYAKKYVCKKCGYEWK